MQNETQCKHSKGISGCGNIYTCNLCGRILTIIELYDLHLISYRLKEELLCRN